MNGRFPVKLTRESCLWAKVNSNIWTLPSLKQRIIKENENNNVSVKLSNNRWFMYNESTEVNKKLLKNQNEDKISECSKIEMLDFMNHPPKASPYAYYTNPLSSFSQSLCDELTIPFSRPYLISLWISNFQSGTRTHYDAFDNTFVQLDGEKRFRLYSPKEHFSFHLYPDSHSRARKSQIDIDDTDFASKFPLFKDMSQPFIDIILKPGDALCIPAFWFHEVQVESKSSVSLNVFTPSDVSSLATSAFANLRYVNRKTKGRSEAEIEFDFLCFLARSLETIFQFKNFQDFSSFLTKIIDSRFVFHPELKSDTYMKDFANLDPLPLTKQQQRTQRDEQDKYFHYLSEVTSFQTSKNIDLQTYVGDWKIDEKNYRQGVKELIAIHLLELWIVNYKDASHVLPFLKTLSLSSDIFNKIRKL